MTASPMLRFTAGTTPTVLIPLLDEYGNGIANLSGTGTLTITDELEQVIAGPIAITGLAPGATTLSYTFTAQQTTLQNPILNPPLPNITQFRGLRNLLFLVDTAAGVGTVQCRLMVLIQASAVLVIPSNTFQTYGSAVLTAMDISNIDGWNEADEDDRITALTEAWYRLALLKYRMVPEADQARIIYPYTDTDLLRLNLSQWTSSDPRWKRALCKAQIIHASFLLGDDPVAVARASGVMASTIGESKQFFRTTKPYEGPVCSRAMKEIAKWLDRRMLLGRA